MQVVLKFGSHIFSVCNLFEKHNTSIISDACGTLQEGAVWSKY